MSPCLLLPLLIAAAGDTDEVLREVAASCQTGTLIFCEGDCLAVKVFSKSRFTHCGTVVVEDGKPIVYDAMNGAGVRRTELVEYLRLQTPSELEVVHPAAAFSEAESQAFAAYLHSQLGRPYGVKHHVTGKRATGIHCAEYCTDALIAAGKVEAAQPARVSPGSLHDGVLMYRVYTTGGRYELRSALLSVPAPEEESWCGWAWRETRDCTVGCYRQMSRWFLCCEK